MTRPIISILLIIVAVAAFFTLTDPIYKEAKDLSAEGRQFDEALNRSRELQSIRDDLLSRYNTFSAEDLERIEKLLPDNVDNVRLILDINSIASKYGMVIRNVSVLSDEEESEGVVQTPGKIGEIRLSFDITAPYEEFKKFIKDLEWSLRIVDVEKVGFSAQSANPSILDFSLRVKTYWLK